MGQSGKTVLYSSVSAQNFYEMDLTLEDMKKILAAKGQRRDLSIPFYLASAASSKGKSFFRVAISHHMRHEDWVELLTAIEPIQSKLAYADGYTWPIDFLSVEQPTDVHFYLLPRLNCGSLVPVQKLLYTPQASRWKIAISLFERLLELKNLGITLNGFGRENVFVREDTGEVVLYPGFYISRIDPTCRSSFYNTGFLAVPTALSAPEESGNGALGYKGYASVRDEGKRHVNTATFLTVDRGRDMFSAATLTFMLLYFTHPFIGGRFWSLLREEYLNQYMHFPDYIFDTQKKAPACISQNNLPRNALTGYFDFEKVIREEYEKTTPHLKELFDMFFTCCTHPDQFRGKAPSECLDPAIWITSLKEDAEVNDRPEKRTDYDFSIVRNYQV